MGKLQGNVSAGPRSERSADADRAASRWFISTSPTARSIAEACRAQQSERKQFEAEAGVRLDAHGHIVHQRE
jgi:hypothetical protein